VPHRRRDQLESTDRGLVQGAVVLSGITFARRN
jgi:hypothetical protein